MPARFPFLFPRLLSLWMMMMVVVVVSIYPPPHKMWYFNDSERSEICFSVCQCISMYMCTCTSHDQ